MLLHYIDNYESYKNHRVVIYRNSQDGIIQLVENFIKRNVFDRNKIIILDPDVVYHFSSAIIIPNKAHIFDGTIPFQSFRDMMAKYIVYDDDKFHSELQSNPYFISLQYDNLDNLCLMKTNNSSNITSDGVIDNNVVKKFCQDNKLVLLEQSVINDEVLMANIIYRCKIFVVSWGTAFFKNMPYVSDRCEKIIVIVNGGTFHSQYTRAISDGSIPRQHCQTPISYHVVDGNNINCNIWE